MKGDLALHFQHGMCGKSGNNGITGIGGSTGKGGICGKGGTTSPYTQKSVELLELVEFVRNHIEHKRVAY